MHSYISTTAVINIFAVPFAVLTGEPQVYTKFIMIHELATQTGLDKPVCLASNRLSKVPLPLIGPQIKVTTAGVTNSYTV